MGRMNARRPDPPYQSDAQRALSHRLSREVLAWHNDTRFKGRFGVSVCGPTESTARKEEP